MLPNTMARIETLYPLNDWDNIWKNLSFKYVRVYDRPIIFKYLHEIMANNKRLWEIKRRNDPLCDSCQIEDSNIHRFYYCQNVQESLSWLKRLIFYFCGMNIDSMLNILLLDLPKVNIKVRNTLCITIISYIANTWFNRDKQGQLINSLKIKIVHDQKLNMEILKDKGKEIFTENYCKSNIDFIYRL